VLETADDLKKALLAAPSFGMPDPALGSTSSAFLVKLFEKLGISDAMRPKIRFFKEGLDALNAISRGELALTITPITSIRMTSGVQLVGPLPDSLQEKTIYAAALTVRSSKSEAAKALLERLRSSEFAAVMRDRGIDPL
jgi:molybdate transport system substrate-binding protein